MSGVSDYDYEHACKVWTEFEIKNMGEYHDLYLRTDVILLANVFESFRNVCMKNYGWIQLTSTQLRDWLGKLASRRQEIG